MTEYCRHKWKTEGPWRTCVRCGCFYNRRQYSRTYHQPDGEATGRAGPCLPKPEPQEGE